MSSGLIYDFQRLNANVHDRARFRCESRELTNYIHRQARQDVTVRACACFIATPHDDPTRIAGYYTLSATSTHLVDLPEGLAKRLPRYPNIPATLLGRLARDLEFRGQGLGEILMGDAFIQSVKGASNVGSALIVVDPKDPEAAAFYSKFGFEGLDDHRMFVTMHSAAEWLRNSGVVV
jgi:ribosomal protein S18 acetylase RimI-like enzyme